MVKRDMATGGDLDMRKGIKRLSGTPFKNGSNNFFLKDFVPFVHLVTQVNGTNRALLQGAGSKRVVPKGYKLSQLIPLCHNLFENIFQNI